MLQQHLIWCFQVGGSFSSWKKGVGKDFKLLRTIYTPGCEQVCWLSANITIPVAKAHNETNHSLHYMTGCVISCCIRIWYHIFGELRKQNYFSQPLGQSFLALQKLFWLRRSISEKYILILIIIENHVKLSKYGITIPDINMAVFIISFFIPVFVRSRKGVQWS